MHFVFTAIKQTRIELGLSQLELAQKAGVGVATLQNIEAGRANPAIGTLQSILGVLGLEFSIHSKVVNWSNLSALGIPLMAGNGSHPPITALDLIEILNQNAGQLVHLKGGREAGAFAAWLWAIKDHWPTLWKHIPPSLQTWFAQQNHLNIKLRRLAIRRLTDLL